MFNYNLGEHVKRSTLANSCLYFVSNVCKIQIIRVLSLIQLKVLEDLSFPHNEFVGGGVEGGGGGGVRTSSYSLPRFFLAFTPTRYIFKVHSFMRQKT